MTDTSSNQNGIAWGARGDVRRMMIHLSNTHHLAFLSLHIFYLWTVSFLSLVFLRPATDRPPFHPPPSPASVRVAGAPTPVSVSLQPRGHLWPWHTASVATSRWPRPSRRRSAASSPLGSGWTPPPSPAGRRHASMNYRRRRLPAWTIGICVGVGRRRGRPQWVSLGGLAPPAPSTPPVPPLYPQESRPQVRRRFHPAATAREPSDVEGRFCAVKARSIRHTLAHAWVPPFADALSSPSPCSSRLHANLLTPPNRFCGTSTPASHHPLETITLLPSSPGPPSPPCAPVIRPTLLAPARVHYLRHGATPRRLVHPSSDHPVSDSTTPSDTPSREQHIHPCGSGHRPASYSVMQLAFHRPVGDVSPLQHPIP